MATQDGQPDGLEFGDRTNTLIERTTGEYEQTSDRHPASLLDRPGISVNGAADDDPDDAPPATDILPTIAEAHEDEEEDAPDDDDTGEPQRQTTVHVADTPEPATQQRHLDQTDTETPASPATNTLMSSPEAQAPRTPGPAYTLDADYRRRSTRT